MKIKEKHVYVTGANRGIGLAVSQELNRQGAYVHLCVRTIDESITTQFAYPDKTSLHELDLSSVDSINHFIEQLNQSKNPIDIIFNNAGQLTGGLIENQDIKQIYSMFQVNLVGLVHLTAGILPIMLKQGAGKIINNSSVSGIMSLPCASTYSASKTAIVAFTRCLQSELKGTGVSTLTLITPGIKTRMYDEIDTLYGNHMDLSNMSSISAEQYAVEISKAIEKDQLYYRPSGSIKLILAIAVHFPRLFYYLISKIFTR